MKTDLIQILIFLSVCFAQIHCNSTQSGTLVDSTMISSTMVSTGTSSHSNSAATSPITSATITNLPLTSSNPISSSMYPSSMTIISSTGPPTSSNPISSSMNPSSMTMISSTGPPTSSNPISSSMYPSPMTIISSTGPLTSSNTINSSPHTTANMTNTYVASSSTPTSLPPVTSPATNVIYNLTYQYNINSSVQLKLGNITNQLVLTSVQQMVASSFNPTGFTITVTRVEIRLRAKSFQYQMLTDNSFQSSSNSCNLTCVESSVSNSVPTLRFLLPDINGTLTNASATSSASLTGPPPNPSTMPTTINYPQGESPPGVGARVGMGLGITIIAIIFLVEIIYFYRKYGCDTPMRQSNYELPSYNHRLSA